MQYKGAGRPLVAAEGEMFSEARHRAVRKKRIAREAAWAAEDKGGADPQGDYHQALKPGLGALRRTHLGVSQIRRTHLYLVRYGRDSAGN